MRESTSLMFISPENGAYLDTLLEFFSAKWLIAERDHGKHLILVFSMFKNALDGFIGHLT